PWLPASFPTRRSSDLAGRERLVLSRDDLLFDDGRLRVRTRAENETELLVFPRLGAPLCAAQTSETGESLATSSVGKRRQRDECQDRKSTRLNSSHVKI